MAPHNTDMWTNIIHWSLDSSDPRVRALPLPIARNRLHLPTSGEKRFLKKGEQDSDLTRLQPKNNSYRIR